MSIIVLTVPLGAVALVGNAAGAESVNGVQRFVEEDVAFALSAVKNFVYIAIELRHLVAVVGNVAAEVPSEVFPIDDAGIHAQFKSLVLHLADVLPSRVVARGLSQRMLHEQVVVDDIEYVERCRDAILQETKVDAEVKLILLLPCDGRSSTESAGSIACHTDSITIHRLALCHGIIPSGIDIVGNILITNHSIAGTYFQAAEDALTLHKLLISCLPGRRERGEQTPAVTVTKL